MGLRAFWAFRVGGTFFDYMKGYAAGCRQVIWGYVGLPVLESHGKEI